MVSLFDTNNYDCIEKDVEGKGGIYLGNYEAAKDY